MWNKLFLALLSVTFIATPGLTAEVKTAQSGQVKAELSYQEVETAKYSNKRLKISRAGQIILDSAMPKENESDWPIVALGNPENPMGFFVKDLDGNKEPEVIVDFFTGGAHCCSYSLIYGYKDKTYTPVKHLWGNGGYQFKDLDNDGLVEWVSRDDRFAYSFTAYAASAYPIQIWQYRDGKMLDVTRKYPKLIYDHAYQLWQEFDKRRKTELDADGITVKGVLAAYLADKYLLGQADDGWKRVRQAYTLSNREEFFKDLQKFLKENGYANN